ncbi:RNA polymerase II transcription factor SIII subunit A-domain-containing protein [Powellomyces hirtus]|nr:RNA polymerase II transcription factor SIII subunit A-domain-containing protein [Powellomyces hirtus]
MIDTDGYEQTTLHNPERLSTLCLKRLDRNLHRMKTFGRVPYYLVKGIVRKATPGHLEELEKNSQNLLPDSTELWRAHCLTEWADVRRRVDERTFDEPDNWRDFYLARKAEQAEKIRRIGASMRLASAKAAEEKQANQIQKIDTPFSLLPARNGSRNGWGAKSKRNESSILTKAKRDAKKISKHFEVASRPVAGHRQPIFNTGGSSIPHTASTPSQSSFASSTTGAKRSHSESIGSGSLQPIKKAKTAAPYKSKTMASLARKMR